MPVTVSRDPGMPQSVPLAAQNRNTRSRTESKFAVWAGVVSFT